MANDMFDGHILAEKLSKLNNSQQSIESVSRWCVSHRKKAKQIVERWDKLFKSSQKDQCVSFLYLANDILQNSRRKGSEFVNEFWKVLPAALKHVHDNGDEHGKKVLFRLIDIWEERKVFGSRGQNLKDEILGKDPPPLLVSNGKISNPIKIVKRDAHSVRIKLAVGGIPEKLLTAFQAVEEEHANEEAALSKCKTAIHYVTRIENDVEKTSIHGDQASALVDELQQQETILQQCVGEFETAEATRAALASWLREALQEQESKLELVHTQLQVARSQMEQTTNMRKRLTSSTVPGHPTNLSTEAMRMVDTSLSSVQPTNTPPRPTMSPISFAPVKVTEEEKNKSVAAAVAAKLAASASSAHLLTSVLSSFVAEEAAAMNGGLKSASFAPDLPMYSPQKRAKLEKPMSDASNSDVGTTAYISPLQQQTMSSMALAPPTSMQSMSQPNQLQAPYPPPLPPPQSPANPQANQFIPTSGMMVGVMPYGYGGNTLPPPPPLPPHVAMGLARPAPQPPQQPQQSQQQHQHQHQQPPPPTSGGYYRPPGIGFYGQSHQPSPPPVPRQ